ncbi:MAG: glycoside hydrolase family 32 protein [Chloroflexi bacterium]|nr:glycoside hydrolase family 32 protein [Chloroflexota bacterium]
MLPNTEERTIPRPLDAADFHRPRYHFLPAANWMNDPNGVIYWQGAYHLFFQYNPAGAWHGNIHWGHAISADLARWRELPTAIAPSPNSPDQGGIFSGCMVDDAGTPTAFYTGVNDDYTVQTQCLARGSEDLRNWRKYPGNPVISEVPPALGQTRDFRDTFVWRGESCWYMALASHIVGVGGAVLLYRSQNLIDWHYAHPLYVGEKARNGRNFECPNFFPLGDKWVLILSAQLDHSPAQTLYFVGRLEDERFFPEREAVYDAGCSYASLCGTDAQGRALLYSWLREERSQAAQREVGWTGVQAVPRLLSLDGQNRLVSQPVAALKSLRGAHSHYSAEDVADGNVSARGLWLDIEASFDTQAAASCGLAVAVSPDGCEKASIIYDSSTQTLQVHRQYREGRDELDSAPQGIPHRLDAGEALQLRILLDGSVIEVIANGRARISSRYYMDDAANDGLRVLATEALLGLDIWEMSSIW